MALVPIFHGTVTEDGRLVLAEAEQRVRRNYLQRLAGKAVDVVVKVHRNQRSLDQNAYIHVAATVLAEEFGNELDEMKLILMGEKWGWHHSKMFGRDIPIKPHTSSMTVEEASEFIEWLPRWAMTNHGIYLPLPGEVEAA